MKWVFHKQRGLDYYSLHIGVEWKSQITDRTNFFGIILFKDYKKGKNEGN